MIKCFTNAEEVVQQLIADFQETVLELASSKNAIYIAVSGGNTPEKFFSGLADTHHVTGKEFPWEKIHLFWVDERCVASDHEQSNFGMVNRSFLQRLDPCEINFHRIRGESDPYREAERYSHEIKRHVTMDRDMPVFDWILLGAGEDGHTASIFPDRLDVLHSSHICEAVKHPATGQFRVTLTGQVLLHAKRLSFLVTGKAKSAVIRDIFQQAPEASHYPVAYIQSSFPEAIWYMDQAASIHLNISCRGKH